MPVTAGTRGVKTGAIARAVVILRHEKPSDFSAVWLMGRAEISRRQADNAIMYARTRGLVERIGRGRYATTEKRAA